MGSWPAASAGKADSAVASFTILGIGHAGVTATVTYRCMCVKEAVVIGIIIMGMRRAHQKRVRRDCP